MSQGLEPFAHVAKRNEAIREWLNKNCPQCFVEQKHLDEGSVERTYWHYGYSVALRDVMRLMGWNDAVN